MELSGCNSCILCAGEASAEPEALPVPQVRVQEPQDLGLPLPLQGPLGKLGLPLLLSCGGLPGHAEETPEKSRGAGQARVRHMLKGLLASHHSGAAPGRPQQ